MSTYTVKYQAGTYSGTRTVTAEDSDEAKDKVKAWVHREMSLPMYYESYRIVNSEDDENNEE